MPVTITRTRFVPNGNVIDLTVDVTDGEHAWRFEARRRPGASEVSPSPSTLDADLLQHGCDMALSYPKLDVGEYRKARALAIKAMLHALQAFKAGVCPALRDGQGRWRAEAVESYRRWADGSPEACRVLLALGSLRVEEEYLYEQEKAFTDAAAKVQLGLITTGQRYSAQSLFDAAHRRAKDSTEIRQRLIALASAFDLLCYFPQGDWRDVYGQVDTSPLWGEYAAQPVKLKEGA